MQTPAHVQITNLLYRYAECIDSGRLEDCAELFRRATVVMGGGVELDADGALEGWRRTIVMYDGTPRTQHVMTNPIIDFSPDGTSAKVRSQYTVFQGLPGHGLQPIITGGYRDEFGSEDGEWFFTRREYWMGLVGDLSRHIQPGVVPSAP